MSNKTELKKNSPEILDHDLNPYFSELLKFNSLEETVKSAVYQKIRPTVERILNAIVQENFADEAAAAGENPKAVNPDFVSALKIIRG
jgi:hypothetical protein